jgi:myo-inositol-1(or 4)-monophosphatase
LNPWDVAAGIVIVEEAGGKITDMQGQPYALGGPSILASNDLIHEQMVKVAAEVSEQTLSRK